MASVLPPPWALARFIACWRLVWIRRCTRIRATSARALGGSGDGRRTHSAALFSRGPTAAARPSPLGASAAHTARLFCRTSGIRTGSIPSAWDSSRARSVWDSTWSATWRRNFGRTSRARYFTETDPSAIPFPTTPGLPRLTEEGAKHEQDRDFNDVSGAGRTATRQDLEL